MMRAPLYLWISLTFLAGPATAPAAVKKPVSAIEAMKRPLTKPAISGRALAAFEQFRKLVGVRMTLDLSSLTEAGVTESDKVAVKVDRATGEQLLDIILAKLAKRGKPLAWYIDQDTVHVTTQKRVLWRGRLPARRRRTGAPARFPRAAIRPKRAAVTQLVFDETPAEEAIEHLRRLSGLNVHVNWSSLELVGLDRDTPVTLKASGITLRRAMDLVVDELSPSGDKLQHVYWVVDGGVITIATGAALNRKMRTRVYNVADLLAVVPNFKAPEMGSAGQGQGDAAGQGSQRSLFSDDGDSNSDDEDQDRQALKQRARETLVGIIKDAIGQNMWQPVGKGSARLLGDKLVISQTLLGFKLLEEAARPR